MELDLLKKSYQDNEALKAICDLMSMKSKNQNETGLHRIAFYLKKDGFEFERADLIAALRMLEKVECGKYVEGRHGWKSRFVWSVKSKLVAGTANGTVTTDDLLSDDFPDVLDWPDFESTDSGMIFHSYVLRPDLTILIELPADISRNETQRLSQFVDSLSFEE